MSRALAASPAFDLIVPATILGAWPSGSIPSIHCGATFAATMTEEERAAFAAPAQWLGRLLADGC